MTPEQKQEKRVIVSGLTHTISISDLTDRFSAFGIVKAIDGLGKLDALGQPRKFAFVTLESTPAMHAKCAYTASMPSFWPATDNLSGFNLLSGTIWKGAKLRLGEAKPDYAKRYAASPPIPIVEYIQRHRTSD
jgi:RNA recognition motif. (a.k.a. RRM, RBD, or RNP domain)